MLGTPFSPGRFMEWPYDAGCVHLLRMLSACSDIFCKEAFPLCPMFGILCFEGKTVKILQEGEVSDGWNGNTWVTRSLLFQMETDLEGYWSAKPMDRFRTETESNQRCVPRRLAGSGAQSEAERWATERCPLNLWNCSWCSWIIRAKRSLDRCIRHPLSRFSLPLILIQTKWPCRVVVKSSKDNGHVSGLQIVRHWTDIWEHSYHHSVKPKSIILHKLKINKIITSSSQNDTDAVA